MYRDLLTQALGQGEAESRPDDLLLAELVDSRARLHATGAAAPVAEALARELSYDGALIRLCASLDVRATPAWFDSPERERARLERELARRGIRLPAPPAPIARRPPGIGPGQACADAPAGAQRPSVESTAVPGDDERMVEAGGREVRVSRPDKIYFPALDATKFDLVSYYLDVGDAPAEHRRRTAGHAAALPRRRHRASPSTKSASRPARRTGCSRPPSPRRTAPRPMPSSSPTSPMSSGR